MYAFYLVRGHSKKDLEGLTYTEKLFYVEAMKLELEREQTKYNSLLGGGK